MGVDYRANVFDFPGNAWLGGGGDEDFAIFVMVPVARGRRCRRP